MLKTAVIILALGFGAPAEAACVVHVDQLDWLFKENNRGFGSANVQILHDITADTLKDLGYESIYTPAGDPGSAEPTHELSLKYTHTTTQATSIKPAASNHQVTMVWTDKKTGKSTPFQIANLPLEKRNPKKLHEAKEVLFDMAEEHYFTALKKIPPCPTKE